MALRRIKALSGALLGWLAPAGMAFAAADLGQESVEALEARLREGSRALREAAASDPLPIEKAAAACEALLPAARGLVLSLGEDLAEKAPTHADDVRSRIDDSSFRRPAESPVVLYGAAGEEEILELWRGQLREALRGTLGVLDNDGEAGRDWLDGTDWKRIREGRPFFRAEQVRNGLHEIAKLLALLTAPRRVVRLAKGEVLFRDDFSKDLSRWTSYGGAEVSIDAGRLRMAGEACTVWCEEEADDALVAFDFRPVSLQGKGAGSLFAYPASPLPGKDFSVSAGPMPNYNYGIATYHCSLCRGDTGMTNLRRTGRGLRMLSTARTDPCRELGRTYRVEILKRGPTVQVRVDGRLFHSYFDAGAYGPPLSRGRFGIRHFAGGIMVSTIDNFEMAGLVEK